MPHWRNIIFILLTIAVRKSLIAQPSPFFVQRGNNFSDISCGGVLFAPLQNQNHQAFGAGAAWVRNRADLRQPFTVSFILDFPDTTATDGGAFVFQADSNAVGETFNGLGYRKIDNSIAITFDAIRNNYDNDPAFDHLCIQSNGNLDHRSANNLAGPVSIEKLYTRTTFPGYPDVAQFHHLVTISWNPVAKILTAAIDGSVYLSLQNDIVQTIFNGDPMVYWGFTASNTQQTAYPASEEVTFGYMYFFFGNVFPRYATTPVLDTCFIQPVQFFDSSLYLSDYSLQDLRLFKWFWSFGDGTISTERNPPPHNYPGAGSYEFQFTATNQLGCTTDTLRRIIKLGSVPRPDFSSDVLCTHSATQFTDLTKADIGIPVAWQWDFGNGNSGTGKNPATTFAMPGLYTVTLSVSTEFGCKADTSKSLFITDKPAADFTYSKDCNGLVNYAAGISNNVPVGKPEWHFGDGYSSNGDAPLHYFSKNGMYTSTMTVLSESGCASDTIKKNIVINKVYPFAGNDTILAIGQSLQLTGSGGTAYHWSPATGLDNPFIENPVAVLSQDQVYVLSVKNEDGCEASDTIKIKVYEGPEIYVPTAFSPNGDGLNDLFHITIPGIRQLNYFRVFDRWGQLLFQTTDSRKGWDGTIKGAVQAPGVYVWIIKAEDFTGNNLMRKGTVTLIR